MFANSIHTHTLCPYVSDSIRFGVRVLVSTVLPFCTCAFTNFDIVLPHLLLSSFIAVFRSLCMLSLLRLLCIQLLSTRDLPISVFIHFTMCGRPFCDIFYICTKFAISLGKLYANAKYGIRLSGNGFSSERARECDSEHCGKNALQPVRKCRCIGALLSKG